MLAVLFFSFYSFNIENELRVLVMVPRARARAHQPGQETIYSTLKNLMSSGLFLFLRCVALMLHNGKTHCYNKGACGWKRKVVRKRSNIGCVLAFWRSTLQLSQDLWGPFSNVVNNALYFSPKHARKSYISEFLLVKRTNGRKDG